MKKTISLLLCFILLLTFTASCSDAGAKSTGPVDVDLTKLSGTMVYAEVYNMMTNPTSYMGKTVKLKGPYSPSYYEGTKKYYHYIVIADATACCSQGLEFVWNGEHSFPADYPSENSNIEITGTFGSYTELGTTYYVIFTDSIDRA